MKIEHLFSSPLYVNTLDKKDQELVTKLIPVLEDDFYDAKDKNENPNHWNCLSYQTFLHGNGQDELTKCLYKYIDEYLVELGFYGFKYTLDGWFNIYDVNHFQESHEHLPDLFSGMVVMQFDKEKHLPTEFHNITGRDVYINLKQYIDAGWLKPPTNFSTAHNYMSLSGMEDFKIFIWSGSQLHRVPKQPKADKLRITYTFNVNPVDPT